MSILINNHSNLYSGLNGLEDMSIPTLISYYFHIFIFYAEYFEPYSLDSSITKNFFNNFPFIVWFYKKSKFL